MKKLSLSADQMIHKVHYAATHIDGKDDQGKGNGVTKHKFVGVQSLFHSKLEFSEMFHDFHTVSQMPAENRSGSTE